MSNRPTPYSVALAALIALHCEADSPLYRDTDSAAPSSVANGPDDAFAQVDSFLQECLLYRPALDRPLRIHTLLQRFYSHGKTLTGIVNNFRHWLAIAAMTLDAFVDLSMTLQQSVRDGTIDAESINGIFLRSVCLGLDQLPFESMAAFWRVFRSEVMMISDHSIGKPETQQSLTHRERREGDAIGEVETPLPWISSAEQQQQAIREECTRMVRYGPRRNNNTSTTITYPIGMQLPARHFAQFVSCMLQGERVGAMDALHQYMDYALIQNTIAPTGVTASGTSSTTNTGVNTPGGDTSVNKMEESPGDILQFAAILKALLHYRTGDITLSRAATAEAVRVAQQSQHTHCVAFALGWLALHARNTDGAQANRLLELCVQRASQARIRTLVTGANLLLAQQSLQTAQPVDRSWRYWNEAITEPVAVDTGNGSIWEQPTHLPHISDSNQVLELMAKQKLVEAGIWENFGFPDLSQVALKSALCGHAVSVMSTTEIQTAIQNLSHSVLFGSCAEDDQVTWIATATTATNLMEKLEAACNLDDNTKSTAKVIEEKAQGDFCIYVAALDKLDSLCRDYDLDTESFWLHSSLILHEWSIRRGDLKRAQSLMLAIEGHLHSGMLSYDHVYIDVENQKCLLLSRQGYWDEAVSRMKNLVKHCRTTNNNTRAAELLLHLAILHLESNSSEYANALLPVTECLDAAKTLAMDGLRSQALSILAQIHLRMGNTKHALGILRSVLPSVLQNAHRSIQGEAYLTMARCYLSQCRDSDLSNRSELLTAAIMELKQSESFFWQCHDCRKLQDVYYSLADAYHALGASNASYIRLRDICAENFVKISQYQHLEETGIDELVQTKYGQILTRQSLLIQKVF